MAARSAWQSDLLHIIDRPNEQAWRRPKRIANASAISGEETWNSVLVPWKSVMLWCCRKIHHVPVVLVEEFHAPFMNHVASRSWIWHGDDLTCPALLLMGEGCWTCCHSRALQMYLMRISVWEVNFFFKQHLIPSQPNSPTNPWNI